MLTDAHHHIFGVIGSSGGGGDGGNNAIFDSSLVSFSFKLFLICIHLLIFIALKQSFN